MLNFLHIFLVSLILTYFCKTQIHKLFVNKFLRLHLTIHFLLADVLDYQYHDFDTFLFATTSNQGYCTSHFFLLLISIWGQDMQFSSGIVI